ncbi:hypothetical protein [Hydrogenovibrio marinus]|nr:hypothetical protein [Hydrogenovibrio marinus]
MTFEKINRPVYNKALCKLNYHLNKLHACSASLEQEIDATPSHTPLWSSLCRAQGIAYSHISILERLRSEITKQELSGRKVIPAIKRAQSEIQKHPGLAGKVRLINCFR